LRHAEFTEAGFNLLHMTTLSWRILRSTLKHHEENHATSFPGRSVSHFPSGRCRAGRRPARPLLPARAPMGLSRQLRVLDLCSMRGRSIGHRLLLRNKSGGRLRPSAAEAWRLLNDRCGDACRHPGSRLTPEPRACALIFRALRYDAQPGNFSVTRRPIAVSAGSLDRERVTSRNKAGPGS
jgi:hypothetical protein